MKTKKTWLSYVLWGIFCIISFATIGVAAIGVIQSTGENTYFIGIVLTFLYVALGIGAIIGIYKLYDLFIKKKPDFDSMTVKGMPEAALLFLTLLVAVAVRIVVVVSTCGVITGDNSFYNFASSITQSGVLPGMSNSAYIYAKFLSVCLQFLGYKVVAAMYLQVLFQFGIMLFVYFGIKQALGRWQAWISLLLISFLPGSFFEVTKVTQDMSLTLFIVAYLYLLVKLSKANVSEKIKSNGQSFLFILMGCACGYLIFLDPIGIIIMLVSMTAFILIKNEEPWNQIQMPWFQCIVFGIATFCSALLLIAAFPANGTEPGFDAIFTYAKLFVSGEGINLTLLTPNYGYKDSIIVFACSGVWMISFLKSEEDWAAGALIPIIGATLFSLFGVDTSEYSAFINVAWCMMAGIGVTSVIAFSNAKVTEEEREARKIAKQHKKEMREKKRSSVNGEGTISLAPVNAVAKSSVSKPVTENGKKSYGIGRKRSSEELNLMPDANGINLDKNQNKPVIEANSNQASKEMQATVVKKDVITKENKPSDSTNKKVEAASLISNQPVSGEVPRIMKSVPKVEPIAEQDMVMKTNENASESVIIKSDTGVISLGGVIQTASQKNTEGMHSETSSVNEENKIDTESRIIKSEMNELNTGINTNYTGVSPLNTTTVLNPNGSETEANKLETAPVTEHSSVLNNNVSQVVTHGRSAGYIGNNLGEKTAEASVPNNVLAENDKNNEIKSQERLNRVANEREKTLTTSVPSMEGRNTSVEGQSPIPAAPSRRIPRAMNRQPISNSQTSETSIPATAAPTRMIKNPLPGPKPHVAKELNYDYLPKPSEMKYDINDLKGKDYYDI